MGPSALVLLDILLLLPLFFVGLAGLAFAQLPFAFPFTVVTTISTFDDDAGAPPPSRPVADFDCCFESSLGHKLEAMGT